MSRPRLIKEDIVRMVCEDTNLPRHTVDLVVNTTLDNITYALSQGKAVKFGGFGVFEPKERAARTGRNPHTKEPVPIPARIIPSFKPGNFLKEAVTRYL